MMYSFTQISHRCDSELAYSLDKTWDRMPQEGFQFLHLCYLSAYRRRCADVPNHACIVKSTNAESAETLSLIPS